MTACANKPLTILVVEDDPLVIKTTAAMLQRLGYATVLADSADAALAICRANHEPIDLVITDVIMDGVNGKQLKDQLVCQRPGLKVLFTSGHPFQAVAQAFELAQDENFIQKPFSLKNLSERVNAVLK